MSKGVETVDIQHNNTILENSMEHYKREDQHQQFHHHFEASLSSTPTNTTTMMSFSDQIPITNISTSTINNYNNNGNNFIFPSSTTIFNEIASSSYKSMDLSTVPDYNSSLFEWLPTFEAKAAEEVLVNHPFLSPASYNVLGSSEVLNTPAPSPASFSIASWSNEATANKMKEQISGNAEKEGEGGDGEGDECTKNEHHEEEKILKLMVETRNRQRKQKEPRYVFHTNTQVQKLEDGFKWRKYGQKTVKNSPFPRSYYRCTTQGCNVKKRVERSSEDHGVVVTTYEGNHTHLPPKGLKNSSLNFMHHPDSSNIGGGSSSGGSDGLLPPPPPQKQKQFNQCIVPHGGSNSSGGGVGLLPPPLSQQQKQFNQSIVPHSGSNSIGGGSSGGGGDGIGLLPWPQQQQQFNQPIVPHQFEQPNVQQQSVPLLYNPIPPVNNNYVNPTASFSDYVQVHENHGGGFGPFYNPIAPLSNFVNSTSSFSGFFQEPDNNGGFFVPSNSSTPPMSNYMNSMPSFSGHVQDHENHGGGFGPSDMLIDDNALLRNNGLLEDILMSARIMRK